MKQFTVIYIHFCKNSIHSSRSKILKPYHETLFRQEKKLGFEPSNGVLSVAVWMIIFSVKKKTSTGAWYSMLSVAEWMRVFSVPKKQVQEHGTVCCLLLSGWECSRYQKNKYRSMVCCLLQSGGGWVHTPGLHLGHQQPRPPLRSHHGPYGPVCLMCRICSQSRRHSKNLCATYQWCQRHCTAVLRPSPCPSLIKRGGGGLLKPRFLDWLQCSLSMFYAYTSS